MSATSPSSAPPGDYGYGGSIPTIGLDVKRIAAAIYRNRIVAAGIVAAALALGVIVTLSTTPTYRAIATIQIDSQVSEVLDEDSSTAPVEWDIERFLQTQMDVLLSRGMAETVADRLKLANDDTYFDRMGLNAPGVPTPGETMAQTRRNAIASSLRANVDAQLPRYSRVVNVSFDSPDAVYAAEIANAYVESFIASNLRRKFDSSTYAREYLEEQLTLAKERLEASERQQVDYARRFGLIDLPEPGDRDGSVSIVQTNLIDANAALNAARTARIAAEERFRAAGGGASMAIPQVQNSPYIQQLQRERAIVVADIARDAERYKAEHPVMAQHSERLAGLDRQIGTAVSDVRGSLRREFEAARRSEQRLASQVQALRSGTAAEQSERIQYNILAREAATNRAMYDELLQRYKEVSAAAGVSTNNISLIDQARVPGGPVRPRPYVNFLLALMAGLALAGLYVFLREFFDDAALTPDDVTDRMGLPYLGSVPKLDQDEDIIAALERPQSAASESFAALRTSLNLLSTEGLSTLLVTSSQQAEGKSLVAYGIARSIARENRRVLLVDADLRRPSQHHILGIERESGLTSVLTRQMAWAEVLHEVDDHLHVIPSGPLPPSVPELLSSKSFDEFRDGVTAAYDVVVFDGPPVMGLADAILLGQRIEHVVFVAEAGRASHGRSQSAIRRLRDNAIHIDGAVLNKFDPRQSGYGYEYGYYYSYGQDKA